MRISDWSSDVCSSDLFDGGLRALELGAQRPRRADFGLDDARNFAKPKPDSPRAPRVADAFEIVTEVMLILAGELGAGATLQLPQPFARTDIRPIMNAHLRCRALAGAEHMDLVDPRPSLDRN